MAVDLAAGVTTGPVVLSSGDAHVGNFGFFASKERSLIFDLNDFDEAEFAPFEWDVKRLAASAFLSAQVHGLGEKAGRAAAFAAVKGYQDRLAAQMAQTALDRFYAIVDSDTMLAAISGQHHHTATKKAMKKARDRTGEKALKKFATESTGSGLRIVDQPPLTRHLDDPSIDVGRLFAEYRRTARTDVAVLARAVRGGGFGSAGRRSRRRGHAASPRPRHRTRRRAARAPGQGGAGVGHLGVRRSAEVLRPSRGTADQLGRRTRRPYPARPPIGLGSVPRLDDVPRHRLLLAAVPRYEGRLRFGRARRPTARGVLPTVRRGPRQGALAVTGGSARHRVPRKLGHLRDRCGRMGGEVRRGGHG